MKIGVLLFGVLGLVALTACGGGGSSSKNPSITSFYKGNITVGMTDNVPADGHYVIQNVYNPKGQQIMAGVQIEGAKSGTTVLGRWYQMGVIQQKAANLTPEGALISEAGFTMDNNAIAQDTKVGGGRLRLVPNAPLPEDSYMLRVFVDGKLAKTETFVVSNLVPALGQPSTPPAAPSSSPAPPTPRKSTSSSAPRAPVSPPWTASSSPAASRPWPCA